LTRGKLIDVIAAIVLLAIITTVVAHPQSAKVISSTGTAFSGSLRAAMGH
jgi:hypothetical protein